MSTALENPVVLVPIRYPLTAQSMQTLERASELTAEYNARELNVLHVNLFQYDEHATVQEIHRAIEPIVAGQPVTVNVVRGFLIEEVIQDEAERIQADLIVMGQNTKASWRRLLSRILGNEPAVANHLQSTTDAAVEVIG